MVLRKVRLKLETNDHFVQFASFFLDSLVMCHLDDELVTADNGTSV